MNNEPINEQRTKADLLGFAKLIKANSGRVNAWVAEIAQTMEDAAALIGDAQAVAAASLEEAAYLTDKGELFHDKQEAVDNSDGFIEALYKIKSRKEVETNVSRLNCITKLDLPPDLVINAALGCMDEVVVIGYDKRGDEYFASSVADGGSVLWLMERAKFKLLGYEER